MRYFLYCKRNNPEKTTITGDYYSRLLKVHLIAAVREKKKKKKKKKKNPPDLIRSGFILHQDNAHAHASHVVKATKTEMGIEHLRHPPYLPDLAVISAFKRFSSW